MGEMVDLVDSSGHVQLQNINRDTVESYDDLYLQIVIIVIFNSRGDLLVQKRSRNKSVDPGRIDHVAGGVKAGEKPVDAVLRETREEAGVAPKDLQLVLTNVNAYHCYRWLFVGTTDEEPTLSEPDDIDWVTWKSIEELVIKRDSGKWQFTDEFWEEVAIVEKKVAEGKS